MQPQIFENRNGSYDVINSHGILFHIYAKTRRKIGKAENYRASGKLIKNIPKKISIMFFEIQTIEK